MPVEMEYGGQERFRCLSAAPPASSRSQIDQLQAQQLQLIADMNRNTKIMLERN